METFTSGHPEFSSKHFTALHLSKSKLTLSISRGNLCAPDLMHCKGFATRSSPELAPGLPSGA